MMKFPKPDMGFVNEQDRLSQYRRESFIRLDFSLQSVIGHRASDAVMLLGICEGIWYC